MSFLTDVEELKPGLIVFRRTDVKHRNWYCRIKVPGADRYKTISLKTADLHEARDKAFDHDADIRFRIKHSVPIFEKTFEEVAAEYSAGQKAAAGAGQITLERWKKIDIYIRLHLNRYIGKLNILHVTSDKWKGYPLWRKENGTVIPGKNPLNPAVVRPARDDTIRAEMIVFRAIMRLAADKNYVTERHVPREKIALPRARREAFTPKEYRHLHTYARKWIKDAPSEVSRWVRSMTYSFILIMANTGLRTIEASNLRWRDTDVRTDRQGRAFVVLNVRGKGKFRELVAASNVADYLARVRDLSKATAADDFVFSTRSGNQRSTLYADAVEDLLTKAQLLLGPTGSRRSSYCLRHTYATFRLMEGVDVYWLAKQMGTSVKMIEDYYGHITPTKNADRILQGMPGWEPVGVDNEQPSA